MNDDQTRADAPAAAEAVRHWQFARRHYETGRFPLLMGIVNVTPDSFSDGGEFLRPEAAVERALHLAEDGADILDIGGESTRPGAEPVPAEEELRRLGSVIEQVARQTSVPISIDTTKAVVARMALEAGAEIVNDISGLTFDADMPAVCREAEAGLICMHIQGTPQTMQIEPHYADVLSEIGDFLKKRLEDLQTQGIPPSRVVLDPGIGFGKTAEHNLQILSHIKQLRALGRPVLIGHSRKGFLKTVLGRALDERYSGTLGVSIALAAQATDLLRIHDVRATRDSLLAYQAVIGRVEAG